MTRTQIQFPDPLYQRLKVIAEQQDWSPADAMCKAAANFITLFPEAPNPKAIWRFPTPDCGGDFLTDPATLRQRLCVPVIMAAERLTLLE